MKILEQCIIFNNLKEKKNSYDSNISNMKYFVSFIWMTYFQIFFCIKACGSKAVWCLRVQNYFWENQGYFSYVSTVLDMLGSGTSKTRKKNQANIGNGPSQC